VLPLILILAILLATVLACFIDGDLRPRVRLRIDSLTYHPKTKLPMTTNLRSPVSQFAQIVYVPVDVNGRKVKLDEDAIIAEVTSGTGARARVEVLNDGNGDRRFLVQLIPGDEPGEYQFKVRGDLAPGAAVEILEEEYIYTGDPENAVSLGGTVSYLPKSSLPA